LREQLRSEFRAALAESALRTQEILRSMEQRWAENLHDIHRRLDTLFEVTVRREEHTSLAEEVRSLRREVERLKERVGLTGSEKP